VKNRASTLTVLAERDDSQHLTVLGKQLTTKLYTYHILIANIYLNYLQPVSQSFNTGSRTTKNMWSAESLFHIFEGFLYCRSQHGL